MSQTCIQVKGEMFAISQNGNIIVSIPYVEVKKISAFKRDLGTVDLICFEITLESGQNVEVNEEMEGFSDLVSQFTQDSRFDKNWRKRVVNPAFAGNRATIFRKKPKPESS